MHDERHVVVARKAPVDQGTMSETDRPWRILMISDFYPPVIGGLERHVQTLSRELVRRGHHVAVATLWQDGQPEMEVDQGVRIYRLKGWNRALLRWYDNRQRPFHPTLPDPGVMRRLGHIMQQERPDLVHARGWMVYSFLPMRTWSGAALVVTLHDYSLTCAKKTYVHEDRACSGPELIKCLQCARTAYGDVKGTLLTTGLRVSTPLHRLVDQYVALSDAVLEASQGGARGRPIEVIPSFVPDAVFDPLYGAHRPDFLPPEDNYILFVGALEAHKGFDVLLQAHAGLGRRVPLVLMGAERLTTPTDFPADVTVIRNVPHEDVMAAWKHCALAIVPSIWPEPFGQVAVEAMASGRAVVASRVGGLQDVVVDGVTGLLVPPGDVAALQGALRELLDDAPRRHRMGEAGRARAHLFTASVVTDRIEQLYRAVLERRKRSRNEVIQPNREPGIPLPQLEQV
jgi:glycosyltransferase involved in cell wall biosynthesis